MSHLINKSNQAVLIVLLHCISISLSAQTPTGPAPLPAAWATYQKVVDYETDFADMIAHGIRLVNMSARNAADAKEKLLLARRFGMKYHIGLPDITESIGQIKSFGLEPVNALMIGGVYQGKAIDRHLFTFQPGRNSIIIEPPVYNKGFAYTANSGATGEPGTGEPVGHYFPDMPAPLKAEIVVPQKKFDGKQHLKIVQAQIDTAPAGTIPEFDSVTPDMPAASETKNRKLYRLTFDLTGLDAALLDQVGIAVYWPYTGTRKYWIFANGNVSAAAESTRQALQKAVEKELAKWTEANDGVFPSDVVLAARFGDECFYITGHIQSEGSDAVGYPLWDYSAPSIEAFRKHAGEVQYPRTWGFPEIYGEKAYGWWLYNLHEHTASLAGLIRDVFARSAPGLKLFRNTTRMGVFDLSNNFDGSGQELLTRNLDIVHLDPYPVAAGEYGPAIPRDMSYCAGLARRYNRPLVPWMQAHVYGKLGNVSPEQVKRMADEQWQQGVDAVIWLGYGFTFPKVRPDSWEETTAFHKLLATGAPKPKAKLAVLRSYNTMASLSLWKNQVRNPADWLLQQFLEEWAVNQKKPYDVFELAPDMTGSQRSALKKQLKNYDHVISTIPWKGAYIIDAKTSGPATDPAKAKAWQAQFGEEIRRQKW